MTITRARTRAPYPLFATRGPLYTRENAVNELLFDFTEYGWDLIIYWGIKPTIIQPAGYLLQVTFVTVFNSSSRRDLLVYYTYIHIYIHIYARMYMYVHVEKLKRAPPILICMWYVDF